MQVEITQPQDKRTKQPGNLFNINMKGFPKGMVLGLLHALNHYVATTNSGPAGDVRDFLKAAMQQNPDLTVLVPAITAVGDAMATAQKELDRLDKVEFAGNNSEGK